MKTLSLIEVMAVLAIVIFLVLGIIKVKSYVDDVLNSHTFTKDIGIITTQARSWRGLNPTYTGISVADLTEMGLLPKTWGAGSGVNPTGGNYILAANATDATRADLTVIGMSQEACLSIEIKIEVITDGGNRASCSGGTLTAVFR